VKLPAIISFLLTVVVVAVLASPTYAAGRVSIPEPAKGKGDQCVADSDYMRKNHPSLLKHQRDDTLRQGIRGNEFSLKECVACHAVDGQDAKPVTYEDPKHFCRTCHTYVAVTLDCFECHASTPDKKRQTGELPKKHPPTNALSSWRRMPSQTCQGG
jgi:predicted CXXCH cytochrome family protein